MSRGALDHTYILRIWTANSYQPALVKLEKSQQNIEMRY